MDSKRCFQTLMLWVPLQLQRPRFSLPVDYPLVNSFVSHGIQLCLGAKWVRSQIQNFKMKWQTNLKQQALLMILQCCGHSFTVITMITFIALTPSLTYHLN
eukprot:NODE_54_length_26799_cov_0.554794.p14 type:complete len:101 gc:universal NODE_54_length_26799_cov_0.554794:6256-6558(+)